MAADQWTNEQVFAQLNSGSRWNGATITYSFPTNTAGIYTGNGEGDGFTPLDATEQAAARLTLQLWDDLIAPDMQQVSPGTSYTSSNIEFGMSTTEGGYAHAYFPSAGSVWFNSAYTSGTNSLTNPTVGRHGFSSYIHEIGHALGLNHMGDYNGGSAREPSSYQDSTVYSIMSYYGPNWGSGAANGEGLVAWADWIGSDGVRYAPQTPMINDIMAIQRIYGIETTTRTGDTVYGFNSTIDDTTAGIYNFVQNKNPVLALFDSNGIDTLDLSGWSTSSIINLAPGSFSSCNAMTNNISIAYSCDIENAIGGSGADTISGNALGNRLVGGAGDDTIYALSGNDVIVGGMGNDTIDGGEGSDYVDLDDAWSSLTWRVNESTGNLEIVSGTYGTDKYTAVEYFRDKNSVVKSLAELTGGTTPPPPTPEPYSATVSIAGASSVLEGNSATTLYRFTVTLSKASTETETVNWAVSFPGGGSSASSSDFSGALSGVASFAAGQTTAYIDLKLVGDKTIENDESFRVLLTAPSSGVTVATSIANGIIRNDDGPQNVTLTGTSSGETLNGGDGNDTLNGLAGNDTLNGGAGNDTLDGGTGDDKMYGGTGDDTYVVNTSRDLVSENAGAGIDTVRTSLTTYTLGLNVERLEYTGTSAFTGTGNTLANTITGGNGADTINGGAGADTLSGRGGADKFVFNSALGSGNIDAIKDFNVLEDSIRLENAVFRVLTQTGVLATGAFNIGSAALQSDDRIIYDNRTGALFYDADGTGKIAAIQFATLSSGLDLHASNFTVI
jgi:serralysin